MSTPLDIISTSAPAAKSTWRDWLGVVASVGCAIHCAAMPFVIAYLPGLGLSFLADESFHKWMFAICMIIGLAAFVPGWKLHRRLVPITIATVGLTMIGFAAFGLAGECCDNCQLNAAGEPKCDCCEGDCCQREAATTDSHLTLKSPSNAASNNELVQNTPTAMSADDNHAAIADVDDDTTENSVEAASTANFDQAETQDTVSQDFSNQDSQQVSEQAVAIQNEAKVQPLESQRVIQSGFLSGPLMTKLAPWITPIGGLILVIAHLLNRRYGCRCGCCATPKSTEA